MRRHLAAGLTLACAVLLAVGCAKVTEGRAISAFADPFRVGGLVAANGYSGLRPDAPPPIVVADGSDDGPVDVIARQSVTDIETFWDEAYRAAFTGSFRQVNGLVSWDAERVSGAEFCRVPGYKFTNAAFCPEDYTIGWDRGVLMPAVRDSYGDLAITVLMAHEYGHAVAAAARLNQRAAPTLVGEQQADCFAGVYFRWVAEGNSSRFALSTGEGINTLLAVLIAIRDPLLSEGEQQRAEHGSAFERISAFQFGFIQGTPACIAIDAKQIEARRGKLPIQLQRGQTGELPINRESVRAVAEVMAKLFEPAAPPRLDFEAANAAACRDARPSPPASYCPETNTVTVDLPALQKLGSGPRTGNGQVGAKEGMSVKGFQDYVRSGLSLAGDNTAYSVLVSRYMLAVQQQFGGLALDSTQAGLRTACLTGLATTMMAENRTGPHDRTVVLAAGDLDEAVAGLLTNGLVASDVNGVSLPAGFARIDAFRTGVLGSIPGCLSRYP